MSLHNSNRLMTLVAGVSAVFASSAAVHAAPTYFTGTTNTAKSSTTLGTGATQAQGVHDAFLADVSTHGTVQTFTFESYAAAKTNVTTTGVASPDFNLTFSGSGKGRVDSVNATPSKGAQTVGFNTTAGGSKSLYIVQGNGQPEALNFTFTKPVSAFGFYVTGLGNTKVGAAYPSTLTASFTDGSGAQSIVLHGSKQGGAEFFGFTDYGQSISSLTFTEAALTKTIDQFSIDDIITVEPFPVVIPPAAVPEPGQIATLMLGAFGLFVAGFRKSRRQSLSN
ncbi:hypothetical protein CCAX7_27920 [Capsulimonas corticalis]|uniref:Uncharacterized protein n=1 Tax=Capsulimonas corticalis TaxID=2219043 RepID=A0A402CTH1_9BACT|nr:PEP-CTERM sorting domain-containing protein [Capsulimonas corticalis]BDI30741.1 hypothetical protein CCAX7_27920 [Capsulimonas corticalis]